MGTAQELKKLEKEQEQRIEKILKEKPELAKNDNETFVDFLMRVWDEFKPNDRLYFLRKYDTVKRGKGSYDGFRHKRKLDPEFNLLEDKKNVIKGIDADTLIDRNPELAINENETLTDYVFRIWETDYDVQEKAMLCKHFDSNPKLVDSYRLIHWKRKQDPSYEYGKKAQEREERELDESSDVTYNGDGVITANLKMRLLEGDDTMEKVYEKLGVNGNLFKIKKIQQSRWNAQKAGGEIIEMVAVKVKLEPIIGVDIDIEKMKKLFDEIPPFKAPKIERVVGNKIDKNVMVEIPLLDVHYNKRTEKFITGSEYNSDIADIRFKEVVDQVIQSYPYASTYVLQIGQDFFNVDTFAGTTTGGTPQDIHQSLEVMFNQATMTTIEQVKKLASLGAKVVIKYVPGNHSKLMSWMLTKYLEAYFEKTKNVEVDATPHKRKYVRWGTNLIGFSHGDKEHKNLPFIMQQEAAQDWADTTHREWHLGHLHHLVTEEKGGIIFRRLSALAGTDRWHQESGYVGAKEGAQVFEWHKEKGLVNIRYIIFK